MGSASGPAVARGRRALLAQAQPGRPRPARSPRRSMSRNRVTVGATLSGSVSPRSAATSRTRSGTPARRRSMIATRPSDCRDLGSHALLRWPVQRVSLPTSRQHHTDVAASAITSDGCATVSDTPQPENTTVR